MPEVPHVTLATTHNARCAPIAERVETHIPPSSTRKCNADLNSTSALSGLSGVCLLNIIDCSLADRRSRCCAQNNGQSQEIVCARQEGSRGRASQGGHLEGAHNAAASATGNGQRSMQQRDMDRAHTNGLSPPMYAQKAAKAANKAKATANNKAAKKKLGKKKAGKK